MDQISDSFDSYRISIESVSDLQELQKLKSELLGKKGLIGSMMQSIAHMSSDQKRNSGARINLLKNQISEALENKRLELEERALEMLVSKDRLDPTLPARVRTVGSVHPISQVIEEISDIFSDLGFVIKEGPEIESIKHNFSDLNIPEDHPARQMHDSFYLTNGHVLRTHTSPVQIRTMRKHLPPLKIIAPGKTFRADWDMTHTPMFHQIEGLIVDEYGTINMSILMNLLRDFAKSFFSSISKGLKIRFRPSYFPFTEPSAEMDISLDEGKSWLEILGCGMVHPKILRNTYEIGDNEELRYSGLAFGMGCERLAMLKYDIKDLRQLFEGDLRWSKYYGFSAFEVPSLIGGFSS
jgi:phenylalanyl-tRNA synthetase alpha chain